MVTLIKNFGELLIKNNIKPSYPRIKVLEYLITKRNHPTVDQIYNELVKGLPTLSKTTVYNTLNLFMSADLVRLIAIEDNETRYDANVADHGHFKCLDCGCIYDFDTDMDRISHTDLSQFKILEKSVYFKGICLKCLENKK